MATRKLALGALLTLHYQLWVHNFYQLCQPVLLIHLSYVHHVLHKEKQLDPNQHVLISITQKDTLFSLTIKIRPLISRNMNKFHAAKHSQVLKRNNFLCPHHLRKVTIQKKITEKD
jgi:hypothetical protein